MTEINTSPQQIKGHFGDRARMPEHHLDRAETFMRQLSILQEKGSAPTSDMVQDGRQLLKKMAQDTEVYAYNAAIVAGQEGATENEVHRMLSHVLAGVERLETTQRMLRQALKEDAA